MKEDEIIEQTKIFIRSKFEDEGSGHYWWHVYRVLKNAVSIGKENGRKQT